MTMMNEIRAISATELTLVEGGRFPADPTKTGSGGPGGSGPATDGGSSSFIWENIATAAIGAFIASLF
jgi:hypothetical protein